jgi:hypothetical protein
MKKYLPHPWLLLACLLPAACTLSPADLSVVAVTGVSYAVKANETWALGCVVLNAGKTTAPPSTVRFYYSQDATLDAGDVTIGYANVPSLASSASLAVTYSTSYAVAGSGGTPGTHRIFAVIDPSFSVSDEDRSNNTGSLEVKVKYERLIIDTYYPTEPPVGFNTDTYLWLYSDAGTSGPPLDEDDNANVPPYFQYARIDYTDASGIDPGTVLYVRLRGGTPSDSGEYAIRFMIDAVDPYDASWFFPAISATIDDYEDDGGESFGIPINPATLSVGDKLNRYLVAGETDWFQLVLP